MMLGKLLVDGKDVYQKYGIYVTEGGYNELVAFPPLKEVEFNDWQEEDGIEADLSQPTMNTRNVTISFAASGLEHRYFDFKMSLTDEAYHIFNFVEIGRVFKLRLINEPSTDYDIELGVFKLKFADDFPVDETYEYQDPQTTVSFAENYELDNKELSLYGVKVLEGTMDEIVKAAIVKTNLTRNIKSQSGAIYDPENVTYKSKDAKVQCLMRASSLNELWRNWRALLFDLTRPEERVLYVGELEQEFPCYYKSCAVQEFFPTGKIWLRFTLTLCLTRDFRIEDLFLLATEDGILVFTEDDENAIDLETLDEDEV